MTILRVNRLTHRYPTGQIAIDSLTFSADAGERIALVGSNGAGKTTLFLRLCGVLPGTPGQAEIHGLDPTIAAHRKKLPAELGMIFQNPDDQLFAATLLEDAAFGPLNLGCDRAEAEAKASEALENVGLKGKEDRAPHRLSGGEKRRAALAGVLAMHPGVLLLDEPSMFLDPRGRKELIARLKDLPGTMLIATHDLELVRELCPRTLVLEQGKLLADGATGEVLSRFEF
jgi:cobalt/nickel transport system ATP-binding protein